MAAEDTHYINSGELLVRMCLGLTKLPMLQKVRFQTYWDFHCIESTETTWPGMAQYSSSGPFARSWNPVYVQPELLEDSKEQVIGFETVIRALSMTHKNIKYFDASDLLSLSISTFNLHVANKSRTIRDHGQVALKSAQSISLRIKGPSAEDLNESSGLRASSMRSSNLLQSVLHDVSFLRALDLHFGSFFTSLNRDEDMRPFFEVFFNHTFPFLGSLRLVGLMASEKNFLLLLQHQRALISLSLYKVQLVNGSWAGFIDGMHRSLHLRQLSLSLPLMDPNGADILNAAAWHWWNMDVAIQSFVVNGGQNPLLNGEIYRDLPS